MGEQFGTDPNVSMFRQLADAAQGLIDAAEQERKDREKAAAPHKAAVAAGKIERLDKLVKYFFKNRKRFTTGEQEDKMTRRVLRAQLQENTGAHFLDSGGAYGRGWERAATRDFENEPETFLKWHLSDRDAETKRMWYNYDENGKWSYHHHQLPDMVIPEHKTVWIETTLSGYHTFAKQATYAPGLTHVLHNVFAKTMPSDTPWYEVIDAFVPWLRQQTGIEIYDVTDRGDNTYNYDTHIDQTFQYRSLEIDWTSDTVPESDAEDAPEVQSFAGKYSIESGSYWIMTTHNGCDVRGGYSSPTVYKLCRGGYVDFSRVEMNCDNPDCDIIWDTQYDGYNLHNDEFGKFAQEPEVNHRDEYIPGWIVDEDTPENRDKYFGVPPGPSPESLGQLQLIKLDDIPVKEVEGPEQQMILLVNEEANTAICPCCRKGTLRLLEPYYDC